MMIGILPQTQAREYRIKTVNYSVAVSAICSLVVFRKGEEARQLGACAGKYPWVFVSDASTISRTRLTSSRRNKAMLSFIENLRADPAKLVLFLRRPVAHPFVWATHVGVAFPDDSAGP